MREKGIEQLMKKDDYTRGIYKILGQEAGSDSGNGGSGSSGKDKSAAEATAPKIDPSKLEGLYFNAYMGATGFMDGISSDNSN
jgi:hypothetical protein